MPFRLAALRAGLELQAGTSPPVLQPVPGLTRAARTRPQYDVVRAYLRLLGPATPKHHLDAEPAAATRLLGPYDLFLQTRDRSLLVGDAERRKALWPVLGRPGAVLVDGEIVGTWRPRKSGTKLDVRVELWSRTSAAVRSAITAQAARLADFRGSGLRNVDFAR